MWAQVPAWSELDAGVTPGGLEDIEREVVSFARECGLDPERPLPFRARVTALEATLHVLDKRDGLPHDPERHEQAKVRRTLQHAAVELIGFYSQQHRGIFTPRESNVHGRANEAGRRRRVCVPAGGASGRGILPGHQGPTS